MLVLYIVLLKVTPSTQWAGMNGGPDIEYNKQKKNRNQVVHNDACWPFQVNA